MDGIIDSAENAKNLYVPDFRAWSNFYEKKLKRNTKLDYSVVADEGQTLDSVTIPHRAFTPSDTAHKTDRDSVAYVSPTEQTLQQAVSVMKRKRGSSAAGRNTSKKTTIY